MKKEAERWHLREFLESRPELMIDEIKDFESPDFLCRIAGKQVGIEVVKYYAPSKQRHPPQALENFRYKLSADLAKRSLASGIPTGHYSVFAHRDDFGSTTQERNEIADALIAFAKAIGKPSEATEFHYAKLSDDLQEVGFDEFNFFPSPYPPHWSFPNAHWVHRTVVDDMQNLIEKKMRKLQLYRNHTPTVWLLMLGGAGGVGTHFNADQEIFSATYSFEFDRVFVFDRPARKSYELRKQ